MYLSPQETATSAMGFGTPGLSIGDNLDDEALDSASEIGPLNASQWPGNGDNVALTFPSSTSNGIAGSNDSPSPSMFAPFFSAMGSLFSQMSQMFSGTNGATTQNTAPNLSNCTQQIRQPEQSFQQVSASSTGDPHLAFSGSDASGTSVNQHWDNMSSHGDLLDSDSFRGGYRISTQATQPNANGVTYNKNATVSMNGGNVAVSLNADGDATLLQNGNTTTLQDGQSMNLGRGESVARNADGSVVINDRNRQGGTIATTLSDNGNGVDVNVQADNVDLGGYMVNTAAGGNWQG